MQHKIFPATNDVVFKKIFGDMNNKEVIKVFLSSILNIPKEEYELLKIESPFLNISDSATDKIGILDVKLSTKNKKIIRLTQAGDEYGRSVVLQINGAEQRAVGRMSKQERQACVELFAKYIMLVREELSKNH